MTSLVQYPRVQLLLPLLTRRQAVPPVVRIGAHTYKVEIARHRRARRYVLRLADEADTVRLTVPRGASIAEGLRFAERQAAWIERERGRRHTRAEPWRDGTGLWFRGEHITLRVDRDAVVLGTERISIASAIGDLRPVVEAHLRTIAARELPPRCLELAALHGHTVTRVSVRNQRSRWGACSPRGVITLNWRLLQMPADVSDYVILHELMHLRQANHSRRFWREVDKVCVGWQDAERWLRRHGRDII